MNVIDVVRNGHWGALKWTAPKSAQLSFLHRIDMGTTCNFY